MSLILLIYLASIVGGVSGLFITVGVTICIAILCTGAFLVGDKHLTIKKTIMITLLGIFIWFCGLLIPDKETIYMMAAIKYGQEAIDRPDVKVLGDKVYLLLNQKLDELIEVKK